MMDLEFKKFLRENSPVLRINLKSKSYGIGQIEEMIEKNKNLLYVNTKDSIFLSFTGEKYEEDIYYLAMDLRSARLIHGDNETSIYSGKLKHELKEITLCKLRKECDGICNIPIMTVGTKWATLQNIGLKEVKELISNYITGSPISENLKGGRSIKHILAYGLELSEEDEDGIFALDHNEFFSFFMNEASNVEKFCREFNETSNREFINTFPVKITPHESILSQEREYLRKNSGNKAKHGDLAKLIGIEKYYEYIRVDLIPDFLEENPELYFYSKTDIEIIYDIIKDVTIPHKLTIKLDIHETEDYSVFSSPSDISPLKEIGKVITILENKNDYKEYNDTEYTFYELDIMWSFDITNEFDIITTHIFQTKEDMKKASKSIVEKLNLKVVEA